MKSPSGTLMTVMMTLLDTVVEKLPRPQAPAKFCQAGDAGSANGLVCATSPIDLREVNTMNTNGASQRTAMTSSTAQSTTSTGSTRLEPSGRNAIAIALILPV